MISVKISAINKENHVYEHRKNYMHLMVNYTLSLIFEYNFHEEY